MNSRYHSIPRDLFAALASGGEGPEAIRLLAAAEHSKHALLLRGVLAAAQSAEARQALLARIGWEVLTEVERRNPDVAAQVTRSPAVAAYRPPDLAGRRSAVLRVLAR